MSKTRLPRNVRLLMAARTARSVGQGATAASFSLYLHALNYSGAAIGTILIVGLSPPASHAPSAAAWPPCVQNLSLQLPPAIGPVPGGALIHAGYFITPFLLAAALQAVYLALYWRFFSALNAIPEVDRAPARHEQPPASMREARTKPAQPGTCVAGMMAVYARNHQYPVDGIAVTLTDTLAENPARIGSIAVNVSLDGDLTPEQRDKLQAIAERCKISDTLKHSLDVVVSFDRSLPADAPLTTP